MLPLAADVTPREVLRRAEWAVKDRRQAFVEEYDLALAWADLHGEEPGPARAVEGGDRLVRLGGDGTPSVQDLCVEELAVARGEHVHATRSLLADLLDLRHRLPSTWVAVKALRLEPWVARKVASLSRRLDRADARLVDAAVAEAVGQSSGRLLVIAEAKVIEADTARRASELEHARSFTGVWLSGTREGDNLPGLRDVHARLEAADAVWVDATVQRVADLLAADPGLRAVHHPELAESPSADALRAAAFAWLARPHDLAELLGLLDERSAEERGGRRPRAVLVVHLHQAALAGAEGVDAVARATRTGPLLLAQVSALLRHAHVELTPVVDLNTGSCVNGYEHPERVKRRTMLRTVGTVFPHAGGVDPARVDHDHAAPYDPGGPPGQTGDHNDAPLDRHAHRAKTHLGYRVEQLGLGTYLWTTPHGLHRLVNRTGTHVVDEDAVDLVRRLHAGA